MPLRKLIAVVSMCAALAASAGCGGGGGGEVGAGANAGAAPATTAPVATEPMPDGAFRATITAENPPTRLSPGQQVELKLKVKNNGSAAWPLQGRPGTGHFQVNLGGHWVGPDDKQVKVEQRIAQPFSIGPGAEGEMAYTIRAPDKPGSYVVEIDMVQEMVAWFEEKGSQPLRLNVKVE